jgi:hypothetical protein
MRSPLFERDFWYLVADRLIWGVLILTLLTGIAAGVYVCFALLGIG